MKELDDISKRMIDVNPRLDPQDLKRLQDKWRPLFKAMTKVGWGIGQKY